MAFGKKKAPERPKVDQSNAALLASEALSEKRAHRIHLGVRLTLTAPMLMHRWSSKAIIQMVGKMTGMPMPREPKDLTKEYEASWYRNVDGDLVVPCPLIKACIVNGYIATGGVVSRADLNRYL